MNNFTQVLDLPTTKAFIDLESKTFFSKLEGDIELEDYKQISLTFLDYLKGGKVTFSIVDRRDANKLSTECRVWYKNVFLKENKEEASKLKRMAIIESKSVIGNLYANAIYSSMNTLMPNLNFKSFRELSEAIGWINKEKATIEKKPEELINNLDKTKRKTLINKIMDFFFR